MSWPSDGAPHFPGEIFAREIHEEPDALLGLLEHEPEYARDAGATIVASGSAAEEIHAHYVLPVPAAPMPLLAPLLSVVPGQLFAAALSQTKGYDADRPEGLNKVTIAR